MGVEDKDFMMRQINTLAQGLGNFLGKEDVKKILAVPENKEEQKYTKDRLKENKKKQK